MTNAAANTKASSGAATAKAWPQRFGKMTNVQIKTSRKGVYAIITVDCTKFEQTAFVFGAKLVEQVKAAGIGASVWFKGPLEAVERKNDNGGTYTEDQMKVVYFKNKTVREGASSQADEGTESVDASRAGTDAEVNGGVSETTASEMGVSDDNIDDEIPF